MKLPVKYVPIPRKAYPTHEVGEYVEIAGQMYRIKKEYANRDVQVVEVERRKSKSV